MGREFESKERNTESYQEGIKALNGIGKIDGSYIPELDRITDIFNEKDERLLFETFNKDGKPVYIIGTTNNRNNFNKETEQEYLRLRESGEIAITGQWNDTEKDRFYRDISMIKSGITTEKALKLKKLYKQKKVIYIDKNGFGII